MEGMKYKNIFLVFLVVTASVLFYFIYPKAAEDEDITISTNTTWAAGTYTYRDITISNNATLTLQGVYTSDTDGTGVIINARNITIESGSTISASGQGYAANAGIGKGTNVSAYGGGASHANVGGNHAIGGGGGTILYGSATAPATLGSGGGNGGAGGGAITLNLSGNLSVAGNIYAKGGNGGTNTGSGAGGSIYITAIDLSGTGNISANGGSSGSGGGGGSGGRITIYYSGTNSLTDGNITVAGGVGYAAGGVGSKLIYDKTTKDVTIASDITFDATMGIDSDGVPDTTGVFHFRDLNIDNGANLFSKSYYTTDTDGVGIDLSLTGDLTIASGAKINGIGKGYAYQSGDGKPTGVSNTYGGGGAHGGNGGRGEGGLGGTKYDSTLFPAKPGSGGYTTRGGAGGGAVKITANTITIDGSIDQSAATVVANASNNGGGGGGGTIYLIATTVSGSGTIKADGSNGYGYSGGGGGGRIAIYADTSGFNTDNITAAKGVKGGSGLSADGAVGTVFLYDTASGDVTASSDVTFNADQGVSRDGSARSDGIFYFNNLTVSNNATITIGGYYTDESDGRGVTINLDGDLTIESGSTITAAGQGYSGGNGPGKGTGGSSTSGSGGSYGGLGGESYNHNVASAVYGAGEANHPYRLGSGGGAGDSGAAGGSGGGAITLRILGDIINNGAITANGANANASVIPGWYSGGGSGGSVFLVCESLSGSGTVSAEGGDGGGSDYGSGGGGGGRISVVYATSQSLPVPNFSVSGGSGGGSSSRDGAEGSLNITQRVLPAAEFTLRNPNNNSTEYTNTTEVEIVPEDGSVDKYKDAASVSELPPTFYASGWNNVADGKNLDSSEGEHTMRAWLKDQNELIASSVGSATIILDQTDPTLSVTEPATTTSTTTTISGTVSDNLSGISSLTIQVVALESPVIFFSPAAQEVTVNEDGTFSSTVALSVGNNQISFTSTDGAGNTTTEAITAVRESSGDDSDTDGVDISGNNTASDDSAITSESDSSIDASEKSDTDQGDSDINSDHSKDEDSLVDRVKETAKTVGGCMLGNCPTRIKTVVTYFIIGAASVGILFYLFLVLWRRNKKK